MHILDRHEGSFGAFGVFRGAGTFATLEAFRAFGMFMLKCGHLGSLGRFRSLGCLGHSGVNSYGAFLGRGNYFFPKLYIFPLFAMFRGNI